MISVEFVLTKPKAIFVLEITREEFTVLEMALMDDVLCFFCVKVIHSFHVSVWWLAIVSFDVSEPLLDFIDFTWVFCVEIVDVRNVIS